MGARLKKLAVWVSVGRGGGTVSAEAIGQGNVMEPV